MFGKRKCCFGNGMYGEGSEENSSPSGVLPGDVAYTGSGVTVIGDIVAFDSLNGKAIAEDTASLRANVDLEIIGSSLITDDIKANLGITTINNLIVEYGNLLPDLDNNYYLGDATHRWVQAWVNSLILEASISGGQTINGIPNVIQSAASLAFTSGGLYGGIGVSNTLDLYSTTNATKGTINLNDNALMGDNNMAFDFGAGVGKTALTFSGTDAGGYRVLDIYKGNYGTPNQRRFSLETGGANDCLYFDALNDNGTFLGGLLAIYHTGNILAIAGPFVGNIAPTLTNLSYTFYQDEDTGIYNSAADTMTFVAGGVAKVDVTTLGLQTDRIDGKTAVPLLIGRSNATSVNLGALGVSTIIESDLYTDAQIFIINGTASAPSIEFDGSASTGFYQNSNAVHTSISGTPRLTVAAATTTVSNDLQVASTVDVITAVPLLIGNSNATIVNLAVTGVDTVVKGPLVLDEGFTFQQPQLEAYSDTASTTTITIANTWTPCNFTSMTQRAGAVGFSMDTTTTIGEFSPTFSDRSRYCHMGVTLSAQIATGTNKQLAFAIWRTDGVPAVVPGSQVDMFIGNNALEIQSTAIHSFPAVVSGHKYRLYCRNLTSTDNITLTHVNLFAMATTNTV